MDTSGFFPHGYCLHWNSRLIALYLITDALVALSYYSIPAALFVLAYKQKLKLPIQPLLILFGLFIAFCGGGHMIDIVALWQPVYWLKGWWNAFTAATSVATAIVLVPRVMDFVRMPQATEQLQREKSELQEQQSLVRAVLDSTWEGIVLTGEDGTPLLFNAAAQRIIGEERPSVSWKGHRGTDEDVVRLANGRLVERFTREVAGYGQLFVLRDITERRAADEERMRLQRVVETMRQGFAIIAAPQGIVVSTNPSFDAMYGFARGELIGKPFVSLLEGEEADREQTLRRIRDHVSREQYWEGEFTATRLDGSTFATRSRFNLHSGGEQKLFSLIQVDITEQKRLEEEARLFQEKMIETAKLESIGLLAGGVAHDFNNLLTGILGNSSLVQEQLSPSSPLQAPIRDVIQASERAADLTRQLLAYSGKGRFVMGPVDLSRLIPEIITLVRMSIPGHVDVKLELSPLAVVEGDRAQLHQLLMNLIINAAEAIEESRPGRVDVTTKVADGTAVIEVADNGSGMDEATRARIFDPFFTTKFTGRGLGLAAATGIVRGHRGTIDVRSEPRAGSTFRVTLPLSDVPEGLTYRAVALAGDLTGSGTVLLIDDEESVRNAAHNALHFHGYRVLQAEDGSRGIGLFREHAEEIAVVLLDVTMPQMNGEETLRRLREIRPDVRVIVSSGFNEEQMMEKFAGSGVSGFLPKPYKSSQLAAKIQEALGS